MWWEITRSRHDGSPTYRWVNCILETKTKVGSTGVKDPDPHTNPNINESSTTPKSHTHPPHECDGWAHDPETTAAPPTPKPTRKDEALDRASPTIASCHKGDVSLKEVTLSRYRCANCILETKTKVGITGTKTPVPRTNPNINETRTTPKSHTHPSHEYDGWTHDPETMVVPLTPKPTRKVKPLVRTSPTRRRRKIRVINFCDLKFVSFYILRLSIIIPRGSNGSVQRYTHPTDPPDPVDVLPERGNFWFVYDGGSTPRNYLECCLLWIDKVRAVVFIMNRENKSKRQDLYMSIDVMKD